MVKMLGLFFLSILFLAKGNKAELSWKDAHYVLLNWTEPFLKIPPDILPSSNKVTPFAFMLMDETSVPFDRWLAAATEKGLTVAPKYLWTLKPANQTKSLVVNGLPLVRNEMEKHDRLGNSAIKMIPLSQSFHCDTSTRRNVITKLEKLSQDFTKPSFLRFGFSINSFSHPDDFANCFDFAALVEASSVVIVVAKFKEEYFPFLYSSFQNTMLRNNESNIVKLIRERNPKIEIIYELKLKLEEDEDLDKMDHVLIKRYYSFLFQFAVKWSSKFKTYVVLRGYQEDDNNSNTTAMIPLKELLVPSLGVRLRQYRNSYDPSLECLLKGALNVIAAKVENIVMDARTYEPEKEPSLWELMKINHDYLMENKRSGSSVTSCDGGVPLVKRELKAMLLFDGDLDVSSKSFKYIKQNRSLGGVTLDSVVFPSRKLDRENITRNELFLQKLPKDLKIGCATSSNSLMNSLESCSSIFNKTSVIIWSYPGTDTSYVWGKLSLVRNQVKAFKQKYPEKKLLVDFVSMNPPKKFFCPTQETPALELTYEQLLNWAQLNSIHVIPRPKKFSEIYFGWWSRLDVERGSEVAYATFPLYVVRGFSPEIDFLKSFPCIERVELPPKPKGKFYEELDPGVVIYMKMRDAPPMTSEELKVTLKFAFHRFSTLQVVPNNYSDLATVTSAMSTIDVEHLTGKWIQIEHPMLAPDESSATLKPFLSALSQLGMQRGVHFSSWENFHKSNDITLANWISEVTSKGYQVGLLVSNCNQIIVEPIGVTYRQLIEDLDYVVCETAAFPAGDEEHNNVWYLDTRFYLRTMLQRLYPKLKVYFRVKLTPVPSEGEWESETTKNYLRFVNHLREHGRVYKVNYLINAFEARRGTMNEDVGWWKISNHSNLANRKIYSDRESEYFGEAPWQLGKSDEEELDQGRAGGKYILPLGIAAGVIIAILSGVLLFLAFLLRIKDKLLSEKEAKDFRNGVTVPGDREESTSSFMKYKEEYEVDKKDWQYDMSNILGKGNFAFVYKGIVSGKEAAVKVPRVGCSKQSFLGMLAEVKVMCHVGSHDNVVTFIGCYTKEIERGVIYIATEICENGCLLNNLRSRERKDVANFSTEEMSELVRFSYQIASGMEYISEKRVIHRDLAARNVLLGSYNVCKVGDFGMSRKLYVLDEYVKKDKEPLPWRWMAYEALSNQEFSTNADVWSYGITLWEIFSLGQTPYPGIDWTLEFIDELKNGMRMTYLKYATEQIFGKIKECWELEVNKRPTFSQLKLFFQQILETDHSIYSCMELREG